MGSVLKREGSLDKCWKVILSEGRNERNRHMCLSLTKAQIVAKPPTQKRVNPIVQNTGLCHECSRESLTESHKNVLEWDFCLC